MGPRAANCRCAYRNDNNPENVNETNGLRVVARKTPLVRTLVPKGTGGVPSGGVHAVPFPVASPRRARRGGDEKGESLEAPQVVSMPALGGGLAAARERVEEARHAGERCR